MGAEPAAIRRFLDLTKDMTVSQIVLWVLTSTGGDVDRTMGILGVITVALLGDEGERSENTSVRI